MTKKINEPLPLSIIRRGISAVSTAGVRLSPGILVLELFREVFFEHGATHPEIDAERQLNPHASDARTTMSETERAVVLALRGRRKEGTSEYYYTPAYPQLASHAWLRKKTDRIVRDMFIRGPLREALATAGENKAQATKQLVSSTVGALLGEDKDGRPDLLKDAIAGSDAHLPPEMAESKIHDLLSEQSALDEEKTTELSQQILEDWIEICDLQNHLPRLEWIAVLSTFLRCAIPCWLLTEMQVAVIYRDILRDSLSEGIFVPEDRALLRVKRRNRGLLSPTLTPSNPIDAIVAKYMKARIELNALVQTARQANDVIRERIDHSESRLAVKNGGSHVGILMLQAALKSVRDNRKASWRSILETAETVPAWVSPLRIGQGKNIEEFLRVTRNDHVAGLDDGYLFERVGPKNKKQFRLFPASRVLMLFAYLASRKKVNRGELGNQRLLLVDLEAHFAIYGIDFSKAGGVRSYLVSRLQEIGVLKGKPDAGGGAEIQAPYGDIANRKAIA